MLLLPLIQRELGLRSRRAGSYWGRFAVGGVAMLACVPIMLFVSVASPNQLGSILFHTLIGIAFALCCFVCIVSADVIASEKREGTLGLLFLTNVQAFDVILAKLVSSGVTALTALLALMPFLALPVLAGGVTEGEAFRKALALINALMLALAIGIYSSTCHADRLNATRRAVAWLLALTFLPLIAQVMWMGALPIGVFSPLAVLIYAGDSHYRVGGHSWIPYCAGMIVTQVMSWIFLARGGARMRWMLGEESTVRASTPEVLRSSDAVSVDSNRWPATSPPVEWLIRQQRGLNAIIWCGVILMGGFGAFTFWVPNILIGCLSGAFLAWGASRFFIETRRTGELELLLTTPVGAGTVVRDQWKVLSESVVLPLIVSVGVLLPLVFAFLSRAGGAGRILSPYPTLRAAFTVVIGTLALCRVGLWFGLRAPSQAAAILWTVGVVKGVPYLLGFVWLFVGNVLRPQVGSRSDAWYLLSLPPAVGTILFYFWIIRVAKLGALRDLSGTSGNVTPVSHVRHEIATLFERMRNWKTA